MFGFAGRSVGRSAGRFPGCTVSGATGLFSVGLALSGGTGRSAGRLPGRSARRGASGATACGGLSVTGGRLGCPCLGCGASFRFAGRSVGRSAGRFPGCTASGATGLFSVGLAVSGGTGRSAGRLPGRSARRGASGATACGGFSVTGGRLACPGCGVLFGFAGRSAGRSTGRFPGCTVFGATGLFSVGRAASAGTGRSAGRLPGRSARGGAFGATACGGFSVAGGRLACAGGGALFGFTGRSVGRFGGWTALLSAFGATWTGRSFWVCGPRRIISDCGGVTGFAAGAILTGASRRAATGWICCTCATDKGLPPLLLMAS